MKRDNWFPEMAPPPGGLEGLRNRLDRRRRLPVEGWKGSATAAVALTFGALVWWAGNFDGEPGRSRVHPGLPDAAAVRSASPETVVTRMPTGDGGASFYWIMTVDGDDTREPSPD